MSHTLYYFTGTGNSLAMARMLKEKIDGCDVYPLVKALHENREISGETVGIICPIYMFRTPHIVVDFISRIKQADYLYLIVTNGGGIGNALSWIKNKLKKHGLVLSAGMEIKMPDNYLPFDGAKSADEQSEIFKEAEEKIREVIDIIHSRKTHFDKQTHWFKSMIHPGLYYKMGYAFIRYMAKSFRVTDKCNSCGICVQVCPVDNIILKDNLPVWDNRCEQCYACIQWCPQAAIEWGKKTEGKERYHHPEVKMKEIINQKG